MIYTETDVDITTQSDVSTTRYCSVGHGILLPLFLVLPAYAHFEHFTHYNNRGGDVGPHYAYWSTCIEYVAQTSLLLYVQRSGPWWRYIHINTMAETILPQQANVLKAWPWTQQEIGDFQCLRLNLGATDSAPLQKMAILSTHIASIRPRTTLSSNLTATAIGQSLTYQSPRILAVWNDDVN